MGSLRFTEIQTRPTEVLDLTSLTLDEFQRLVPPFEAAFEAHMADWRLDGRPRTARRFTTYTNCPLPSPEDRLLFILVYLKTYPLQVVQGRLFGMGQSKAHQWIHVLLVVLRATLHTLGDAPTRSVQALAKRLGVAEADVAAMGVPTEEPTTSPLLATMAPNGASSAPRIRLSRRAVIAARKDTIR
jgi:Helix-turn-helix of DDE superfamily endonuclease